MKYHDALRISAITCLLLATVSSCLTGQNTGTATYFTYYDYYQDKGYYPLSPDSLGEVYFERKVYFAGSPLVNLVVKGSNRSSGYFDHDTSGTITSRDLTTGASTLRAFTCHGHEVFRQVGFRKGHIQKTPWRYESWWYRTRYVEIEIEVQDDTPYHTIRHLRPQAEGLSFEMPDTSRLHFKYKMRSYRYADDAVIWTEDIWDVDRRDPKRVLRRLDSHIVWRYKLPRPDPQQTMGPWGLHCINAFGEEVESYNWFITQPIPEPKRRRSR